MVDCLGRLIQMLVVSVSLSMSILVVIAFLAAKRNPNGAVMVGQRILAWIYNKLV